MSGKYKNYWGILISVLVAVMLAFLMRYFLFAHIVVEGHSMVPTLHNRDHMIINKLSYKLSKPKRFDIIVFHATKRSDYIKRVIGLPGDVIQYKNDHLFVNGKKMNEPYLRSLKRQSIGPLTYDFKEKVPKGTIFVLGDNRRNSRDSRIFGPVPINKIVGKAEVTFWPLSHFRAVK
ncbi:signal peptidase I [Scopulibacillus daqui]|uniref:Signal peptidase I n=1 Tax=Scopulibacillus daqui TaxID=1469162 RepID=A0ABS2PWC1_9BACL|nr:signal peptidase I [Scopulibacillus daqui]MBM7644337.1 signal peptidase I [Scopulibacillus daqui]